MNKKSNKLVVDVVDKSHRGGLRLIGHDSEGHCFYHHVGLRWFKKDRYQIDDQSQITPAAVQLFQNAGVSIAEGQDGER